MANNKQEIHNQNIKYKEQISYEYERRFLTSLSILSGSALAFCLTFSQSFEDPNNFLYVMAPSLWLFFIALLMSGALPLVQSMKYDKLRSFAYFDSLRDLLIKGVIESLDENVSIKDQVIIFEALSKKANKKSTCFNRLFWGALIISCVSLFSGIAHPLILITKQGYLA